MKILLNKILDSLPFFSRKRQRKLFLEEKEAIMKLGEFIIDGMVFEWDPDAYVYYSYPNPVGPLSHIRFALIEAMEDRWRVSMYEKSKNRRIVCMGFSLGEVFSKALYNVGQGIK